MSKEYRLSPRPKSPAGSGEDPWGSPSWDPPSARLSPSRDISEYRRFPEPSDLPPDSPKYRSASPTSNFEERYLASSSGWKDSEEALLRTPPTEDATYARTSPTRYNSYDRESLLDKYGFEGREHVYQDRYGFDDPLPSYPERMDRLERYSPSRPSSPTHSYSYGEDRDIATSTMPSRFGSARSRSPTGTASSSGWKETSSTSRSLMPSRRRM